MFRYVWAIKEGIIKTVLKKRKKWSAATCSAQFAGSRNKIMVIYAAIFPTDRGIWRAATRPACTWLPAQRTPQFTWKRFPVDILFLPRLFSTFRFSFCPLSDPFFRATARFHPPIAVPLLFPCLILYNPQTHPSSFARVFFPTLFTPELLPLMNRAGITRCIRGANGAASARWKDRESPGKSLRKGWSARARGSKLSRRYFCPYNEVGSRPADSFEASVEQRRFFFCLLQPSSFLFHPVPTVFFEARYHARRLETELRGKTVVPRFIRIYAIRSQRGCYALKYDNATREFIRSAISRNSASIAMLIENRRFTRDSGTPLP